MKRIILMAIVLGLAGCGESVAEKAEKSYATIPDDVLGLKDRCATAGKVKQAYLDEGNQTKYELWQATEYADCHEAARRRA